MNTERLRRAVALLADYQPEAIFPQVWQALNAELGRRTVGAARRAIILDRRYLSGLPFAVRKSCRSARAAASADRSRCESGGDIRPCEFQRVRECDGDWLRRDLATRKWSEAGHCAPLTAMELRPPAVELAHTDVAAVRETGDIRTRTTCRQRESPSQWLKE